MTTNMKRGLFVENELSNDNPMSTCYTLKCSRIKNLSNEYVSMSYLNLNDGTGCDGKFMDYITKNNFDFVLFGCRALYIYKVFKSAQHKLLKPKFDYLVSCIPNKYFIIQDMHEKTYGSVKNLCELLDKHNFHIIFTFWSNAESKLIRKLTPSCKHHHLPHHIDTNIFKIHKSVQEQEPVQMQDHVQVQMPTIKDIDIMLFGSVHPRHYPFRKRLFDLILENKTMFENVYHIEYDSSVYNPAHCEIGLSQLLNRSKICIATKSRYDYLVGKYFEIPASNCLIAEDIPTDGRELFSNDILVLTNSMSDEEILTKLTDCCKNYSLWTEKVGKLKHVVDESYNLDKYIDRLTEILIE